MSRYANTQKDGNASGEKGGNIMIPNAILFNRKGGTPVKVRCPLSGPNAPIIDYKNIDLLTSYITEAGRIIPARVTNVCPKKQRRLKKAVKNARKLGLLPFAHSKKK